MPPAKDGRRGSKKGAFCEKVFTPPFHPPILSFFASLPSFRHSASPLLLQPGFALLFLSLLLKRTFIKTVEGNRRRRRRVERRGRRRNEEVAGKSRRLCFYPTKKQRTFSRRSTEKKKKAFFVQRASSSFFYSASHFSSANGQWWRMATQFRTYVLQSAALNSFIENPISCTYSTRIRLSQRHTRESKRRSRWTKSSGGGEENSKEY